VDVNDIQIMVSIRFTYTFFLGFLPTYAYLIEPAVSIPYLNERNAALGPI
jgi:hypothetical protein